MTWNDDMPEVCTWCDGTGLEEDDISNCRCCDGSGYV